MLWKLKQEDARPTTLMLVLGFANLHDSGTDRHQRHP